MDLGIKYQGKIATTDDVEFINDSFGKLLLLIKVSQMNRYAIILMS